MVRLVVGDVPLEEEAPPTAPKDLYLTIAICMGPLGPLGLCLFRRVLQLGPCCGPLPYHGYMHGALRTLGALALSRSCASLGGSSSQGSAVDHYLTMAICMGP